MGAAENDDASLWSHNFREHTLNQNYSSQNWPPSRDSTCLCSKSSNWSMKKHHRDQAAIDYAAISSSEWKRRRKPDSGANQMKGDGAQACCVITDHLNYYKYQNQTQDGGPKVERRRSSDSLSSGGRKSKSINRKQEVIMPTSGSSSLNNVDLNECLQNKPKIMLSTKKKARNGEQKLASRRGSGRPQSITEIIINTIPLVLILSLVPLPSAYCQQAPLNADSELHHPSEASERRQGSSAGSGSIELSPIRGPEYVSGEHDLLAQLLQSTGTLEEANQLLETLIKAADGQRTPPLQVPLQVEAVERDYSQAGAALRASPDANSAASSQVPISIFMPAPLAEAGADVELVRPSLEGKALKHRGLLDEIIEASAKGGGSSGENHSVHYDDDQSGAANPESLINAQRALELIRASKQIENFMLPPKPQSPSTTRRPSTSQNATDELKLAGSQSVGSEFRDNDGLSNNESISSLMIRSANPSRKLIANYSHWIIHETQITSPSPPKFILSKLPKSKSQDAIRFITAPVSMTTTTPQTPIRNALQPSENSTNNLGPKMRDERISNHEPVSVASGGDEFLPVSSGHEPTRVRPASKFSDTAGGSLWSNKFDDDPGKWQGSMLASRNESSPHKIVYIGPMPNWTGSKANMDDPILKHSDSKHHATTLAVDNTASPSPSIAPVSVAPSPPIHKPSTERFQLQPITIRPTTTTTSASPSVSKSTTATYHEPAAFQSQISPNKSQVVEVYDTMTTIKRITTERPVRLTPKKAGANVRRKSGKPRQKAIKKSTGSKKTDIRTKGSNTTSSPQSTTTILQQASTTTTTTMASFTETTPTMTTLSTTTTTVAEQTTPTTTGTSSFVPMVAVRSTFDQIPSTFSKPLPVGSSTSSFSKQIKPVKMKPKPRATTALPLMTSTEPLQITSEWPPLQSSNPFVELVTEPMTSSTIEPLQYTHIESTSGTTEQETFQQPLVLTSSSTTAQPEVTPRKKSRNKLASKQVASTNKLSGYSVSTTTGHKRTKTTAQPANSSRSLNRLSRIHPSPMINNQKDPSPTATPVRRSTMVSSIMRLPEMEESTADYSSAQIIFPATFATNTISEPVLNRAMQTTTPTPTTATAASQTTTTELPPASTVATLGETMTPGGGQPAQQTVVIRQAAEIASANEWDQSKVDTERYQKSPVRFSVRVATPTLGQLVTKLTGGSDTMKVPSEGSRANSTNSNAHQEAKVHHPIDQTTNSFRESHDRSHANTIAAGEGGPRAPAISSHFGKRLVEQQDVKQTQEGSHHLDIGQRQQVDSFELISPTPALSAQAGNGVSGNRAEAAAVSSIRQAFSTAANRGKLANNHTAYDLSRPPSSHRRPTNTTTKQVANKAVQSHRAQRPITATTSSGWSPSRSITPAEEGLRQTTAAAFDLKPYSTEPQNELAARDEFKTTTSAIPAGYVTAPTTTTTNKPLTQFGAFTPKSSHPEWSELATIVSTSPYMLNVADGTTVPQTPTTVGLSQDDALELSSPMPSHSASQFHEQLSALFRYKMANRSSNSSSTTTTTTTKGEEDTISGASVGSSLPRLSSKAYPFEYKARPGNKQSLTDAGSGTVEPKAAVYDNATIAQMVLRMFKVAADMKAKNKPSDLTVGSEGSPSQSDGGRQINLSFRTGSYSQQLFPKQMGKAKESMPSIESTQPSSEPTIVSNNANRRLYRLNKNKQQQPNMQSIQEASGGRGQVDGVAYKSANRGKAQINGNENAHNTRLYSTTAVSEEPAVTVLPPTPSNPIDTTEFGSHLEANLRPTLNRNKATNTAVANAIDRNVHHREATYNGPIDVHLRKASFNENLWPPEDQQSDEGQRADNSIVRQNKRNSSTTSIHQQEPQPRAVSDLNALSPSKRPIGSLDLSLNAYSSITFGSVGNHEPKVHIEPSVSPPAAAPSVGEGGSLDVFVKPLREQHDGETWVDGQAINGYRWTPSAGADGTTSTAPTPNNMTEKRKRRREPPVLPALPIDQFDEQQAPFGEDKQAASLDNKDSTKQEQKGPKQQLDEPKGSMISLGNLFARLPQAPPVELAAPSPPLKDHNEQLQASDKPPRDLSDFDGHSSQQQKRRRESGFSSTSTTTPIPEFSSTTSEPSNTDFRASSKRDTSDMMVNASQNQRTSLSPLVDELRAKSLLRTMINLGVPKSGSGSTQSTGGLAGGKNEQVRLVKIDKFRRHNNSPIQGRELQALVATLARNVTGTQRDESFNTRDPVTESTKADSPVTSPAPSTTTTCITPTTSPDAFSTRSTISRWHSGFDETHLRPIQFQRSKLRRQEPTTDKQLLTMKMSDENNLNSSEVSAGTASHRTAISAAKDTQSTSVAPPPSSTLAASSTRVPDTQSSTSTESSIERKSSSISPSLVTRPPASLGVFGQKKAAPATFALADSLPTPGDVINNRNVMRDNRRAPDSKQNQNYTTSLISDYGDKRGSDQGFVGLVRVGSLRPTVDDKNIGTSFIDTTIHQPSVDQVTVDQRNSVMPTTTESIFQSAEGNNSTYKPPIDYPDIELVQTLSGARLSNQLRNLRHSPTKVNNNPDRAIEDFSLSNSTKSQRLGSVQRIAIMTISACCGLVVICLIVVAMSIKCQSSCSPDKYPADSETIGGARKRRDRPHRSAAAQRGSRGETTSVRVGLNKGLIPKANRPKRLNGNRSQSRSNLLLGSDLSADAQGLNSSAESTTSICISTSSENLNNHTIADRADYPNNQVGAKNIEATSSPRDRTSHIDMAPSDGGIHSFGKKEFDSHLDPNDVMGHQQPDMRYMGQHGMDRSRGATLRQRISGTLTSRLLHLHLPRLLPYFALDYAAAGQNSAASNPYLMNHQPPVDAGKLGRSGLDKKALPMTVGDLFGLDESIENSPPVRKDRLERPKSLLNLPQQQVPMSGHAQNFQLRPTSTDKLLRQSNPPIKQLQQPQDDTRKQANSKKRTTTTASSKACCHCQNCSSSWLFRDLVCLNQAGGTNSNQSINNQQYGVVPRGKLPFGAASSVLRSSPLVQRNATNEPQKSHQISNATAIANCRQQIATPNSSRLKLGGFECPTDSSSAQHSQVDNEHHLLIDHETSSNESQRHQQPTSSGYSRQSKQQPDTCYDRMQHHLGTNIVYDENEEEEVASSVNSHFGEPSDMIGRQRHPHPRQMESNTLCTRFSQQRDISRELSNHEILNDLHRRHGEIDEEDEDVEGDSETGNYYNLGHNYHRHATYQLDDPSQQPNESRSSLTSVQPTSGPFKNLSTSQAAYKHQPQSNRQQVNEKPQASSNSNCNCNLVLYPL